ncbi:MAG: hypothetical protein II219_01485 [Alphaproteobacteria bacterium]|nr:hypothetical protein [Alphaproteobacteria bacterium]
MLLTLTLLLLAYAHANGTLDETIKQIRPILARYKSNPQKSINYILAILKSKTTKQRQ